MGGPVAAFRPPLTLGLLGTGMDFLRILGTGPVVPRERINRENRSEMLS